MFYLRLFGAPDLIGADGERCLSVLAHPKRLALLAYLATELPWGFQARDKLLSLLWPESDVSHARNSLRQSLYFLRRRLPDHSLVNRGESDIALDPARLPCDVIEFERAIDAGEPERALELYRGDLLVGFFIPGASPFEHWLDRERRRLRRKAVAAAWQVSDQAFHRQDPELGRKWGRRAVELDFTDEISVRRFIEILGGLGNGAAALRLYQEFANHLAQEYELKPCPETVAAIDRIRVRSATLTDGSRLPPPSVQEAMPRAGERPDPVAGRSRRGVFTIFQHPGFSARRVARRLRPLTALVLGVLLTSWFAGAIPLLPPDAPAVPLKTVAVLPFQDLGQGDGDDSIGDAIHHEILIQLSRVQPLRVFAGASARNGEIRGEADRTVALKVGADYLIAGALQLNGDRIRIWARIIDANSGEQLWASKLEADTSELFRIESETAVQIANALDSCFIGSERRPAACLPGDLVAEKKPLNPPPLVVPLVVPQLDLNPARIPPEFLPGQRNESNTAR